jgi:inward rectifier potassium channel
MDDFVSRRNRARSQAAVVSAATQACRDPEHDADEKDWTRGKTHRTADPQFNHIKFLGLPRQNIVHFLVKRSWTTMSCVLVIVLVSVCVVFALLLLLDNKYSANDDGSAGDSMSFADCLNLSVQTFSTIGFGSLGPTTTWANWIITLESFVGLVFVALVPGITFLKFSLPKAKVRWAQQMLVGGIGAADANGEPILGEPQNPAEPATLTLRCANLRSGGRLLFGVQFDAILYQTQTQDGREDVAALAAGRAMRRASIDRRRSRAASAFSVLVEDGGQDAGSEEAFSASMDMVDLPLEQEQFAAFGVPLTLVHEVQEGSPLNPLLKALHSRRAGRAQTKQLDKEIDEEFAFSICVFMRATDPILQSTVFSMASFAPSQLCCGDWRFEETVDVAQNIVYISKLDNVLPAVDVHAHLPPSMHRAYKSVHINSSPSAAGYRSGSKRSAPLFSSFTGTTEQKPVRRRSHMFQHESKKRLVNVAAAANASAPSASAEGSASQDAKIRPAPLKASAKSRMPMTRASQVISAVGISQPTRGGGHDGHAITGAGTQRLHGVKMKLSDDRYYNLITARWSTLMLGCAVLYFGVTLIFAVVVYSSSGGLSELGAADTQGRFGDAWFFSMQTLSTIGFGSLSPATDDTNMATNVEAAVGIFLIAIINGVVWGKFVTIGQASAVFSTHAVMMVPEAWDGEETVEEREDHIWDLVFRLANNQRGQALVHVKVVASAVIPAYSPGGSRILRSVPLLLDRAYYPMLVVNGEVRHRVDRTSPLFGMREVDFQEQNVCIHVVIEGVETLFKRDFFAAHLYYPEFVKWGHRLTEFMFVSPTEGFVLDMTHFHDIEQQNDDDDDDDDDYEGGEEATRLDGEVPITQIQGSTEAAPENDAAVAMSSSAAVV